MKVNWYKSGLSCNNPILREFVYFKCLIQISKHWGIAIIRSQDKKDSFKERYERTDNRNPL